MKSKGIYNNLEVELERANITRKELREILKIGINTITRRLAIESNISYEDATIIRDYIQSKTGEYFDLEYLFEKE